MPFCIPSLQFSSPSPYQTLAPSLHPCTAPFLLPCQFKFPNGKSSGLGWLKRERKLLSSINGVSSSLFASDDGVVKKRKVVEHILLLRAKTELTDVEEKAMLDNLYTIQYQMRGIIAISLGRIEEPNADNFTHAVYMRFQTKDDLAKFYVNSYYSGVLKEHVMPYCYVRSAMEFFQWIMNLK